MPAPYYWIWRCVSSFLIIIVALVCDLHFQTFHGYPSILLFAGVILSTWYSGFWPGLMTIVIAVLSIDYFFTKPLDTLSFSSSYIAQSAVFVAAAVLISSLVESQTRAEQTVQMLANKQKRFIADASHELFTPLSVIRAQNEVVLKVPGSSLTDYQEIVSSTIEEVDRMTKVVENLLELSSNELKTEAELSSPIELAGLIKGVLDKIKILADGKKIFLTITRDDKGEINGDATTLTHMVINLLQNAIQYTPSGGKVSVGVFAGDKTMQFVIQDTGMGIAPEHLPYIFDPFYKTDEARRRRQSGAGLGLAIVKGVVESHKGKIEVESKVNQGTKITVEFPKANFQ